MLNKKDKKILYTVIALIVIGYAILLASLWIPSLQRRSIKTTLSVICMMFSGTGLLLYLYLLIRTRRRT